MDTNIATDMMYEADEQDRQQWAKESAPWKCVKCGRMHPWHHKSCWWCEEEKRNKKIDSFHKDLEFIAKMLHEWIVVSNHRESFHLCEAWEIAKRYYQENDENPCARDD